MKACSLKLPLGPSFNPSLFLTFADNLTLPFVSPFVSLTLFSLFLSLSFAPTPFVCPCSVVRQTGERPDRADGMHHPTGSRGASTCWQRHWQTGRSSLRTLHCNQLAKNWHLVYLWHAHGDINPEYITFQVNLIIKDMELSLMRLFLLLALCIPNLCKCRCGSHQVDEYHYRLVCCGFDDGEKQIS